jgi:hypothetical protein
MRLVLRYAALFCAGAAAVLVVLELALRLLPVTVGLYQSDRTDLWPLHNFQAHVPYTHSMTWEMRNARHGWTNNYGQLAPFDYVRGSRPVIVVGDSYIEAQVNEYADTLQGQLGAMLAPAAPVYGFGASGSALSDYLVLAGQAAREFAPRAAVFLLINGDISESLLDQTGHYHFRDTAEGLVLAFHPRDPRSLRQRLRWTIGEIRLSRYVSQNLRFTLPGFAPLFREAKARAPDASDEPDARAQFAAVDRFLAELPGRSGIEPRCIAFLLDGNRYGIYDPRRAFGEADLPEARAYFIRRALELGFRVADLQPVFGEHYRLHRRHFDYYPVDAHLNGLGNRLAAEQAYDLIYGQGRGPC